MSAEKSLERHIEELDVDFPDIVAYPFLKDIDEKATILVCAHRALGDQIAGLRIEQALAPGLRAPALVGDLQCLLRSTLDDRYELHPLGAQLIAKEAVDSTSMILVGGVDRAQDVEVDSVPAQLPPAGHDAIEGAALAPVHPVSVVNLPRSIDAQSHEEIVLLEKGAPVVVQQDAVGLEGVLYNLLRAAVLLDQLDGMLEELELHQRRLSSLPSHGDLRRAV